MKRYKLTTQFIVSITIILTFQSILLSVHGIGPDANLPGHVSNEIIVKFKEAVANSVESQLDMQSPAGRLTLSQGLDELNARYRVKKLRPLFKNFKKNRRRLKTLQQKKSLLHSKKERRILRRLKRARKGAKVPDLDRIYKIKVVLEPGQSLEEVIAEYNRDPNVEYAELNYIVSTNLTPNDSLYPVQWSLNNTGQMYPESRRYNPPPGTTDCDIDAPEAWDIEDGSSEVIVAVVDTGVDYTHRDLDDNMWVNEAELNGSAGADDDDNGYIDDIYGYDFINNDSDPVDDHGHGTHCSGTIAAEGDNGVDIAGICWNSKIMALKSFGADGKGDTSDAVAAFYYAVNNGADIISNSWGGDNPSQSMQDAIYYAYSQGVIMLAAAGNDNTTSPHYPAYYNHVIAVAATNSNDDRASFSNYGDWVEIAAPGVDILSLRASGTSMGTTYDNYTTITSGTSMACPHVSGACAVLLSVNAGITVDEVNDTLKQSVDTIASGICQSGRLNIYEALLTIVQPKGTIRLDRDTYSCSGLVGIKVRDSNLKGAGTQYVNVTTDGGDFETTILTEQGTDTGIFSGSLDISTAPVIGEDGILQVSHGLTSVMYNLIPLPTLFVMVQLIIFGPVSLPQ